MNSLKYSITNENAVVIVNGKSTVVAKGASNFLPLCEALLAGDEEKALRNLTVKDSVADWAKGLFGWKGDSLYYLGDALPESLNKRIIEMVANGESPQPLFNFYERVQKNPSYRSVQQLWSFLQHCGIPLTADGCFLAYKAVRSDLKDVHSGTIDNTPGQTHVMERNLVSDDPDVDCHFGFHVGALSYASDFHRQGRLIICKVDPENVVSVPKDFSCQKMRVCKYTIEGFYVEQLSNTVHVEPSDERETGDTDDAPMEQGELDLDGGTTVPVSKKWEKLHTMSAGDLLKQSIDKLRQYAHKALKIIGASKIRGGKTQLINRILEVRGQSGE